MLADFFQGFDSIHRGKIKQILLAYGLPKETVTTKMMLYKDTKAMVYSPDSSTDIVAGFLRGDTISFHNVPRLHTINVNRSNKRKWFHTKKIGKKQIISHINYYLSKLYRWSSASCKYTCTSWIFAAKLRAGSISLYSYIIIEILGLVWFLCLMAYQPL